MDGKVNTPCRVCRGIVAVTLVAVAAIAIAAIIGCSSMGERRRQNIAQVIQTAYDMGGREAVSNRIESLVAEGKLTPSQAARLHALAQLAYEGIMDDLAPAANAAPASASQGGCGGCSLPDASTGSDGGRADGASASPGESGAESAGGSNEDANCGECEDCKAQG